MLDFKREISNIISEKVNVDKETIYKSIETPKDTTNGDYAFPCFVLAKELKKAPKMISDDLKNQIELTECIENVESVNGYLNFYINKEMLTKEVFKEFDLKKDEYGKGNEQGTVCIDYSAPNIAKPFHVGHLRSTVIGHALYNIYKYLGYKTVSINHLGDYGTQFGKLIEGYKLWGNEYDLTTNTIDKLVEIYVRINALAEQDESVLERCRNNFKLLEEGDEFCVNLWKEFSDLSLKEFDKIYDLLGIKFDSVKGESFYIDKMQEVVDILEKNNKLTISEGAKIVDLTEDGIKTPCIIIKSDGTSIYATRDLAAILYRSRTYDYDKSLYVTSYEQDLQFKQTFAVAKYLDLDPKYVKGLEHVSFGMYRLPEGKFSTRKGNFIKLEDILDDAISKAKAKVYDKNPDLEDIDDVAKKVGVGAIVFSDLYNSRIKDEVFDIDEMLNFQGETCPYIQYMYVRINSILHKTDKKILINDINYSKLGGDQAYNIVKLIYNFEDVLKEAADKNEPYILSRYLIDLSKAYSVYYSNNKILSEDEEEQNSRLYLINIIGTVLKTGCKILGIEMPNKM